MSASLNFQSFINGRLPAAEIWPNGTLPLFGGMYACSEANLTNRPFFSPIRFLVPGF
jgi:hypothetical protein